MPNEQTNRAVSWAVWNSGIRAAIRSAFPGRVRPLQFARCVLMSFKCWAIQAFRWSKIGVSHQTWLCVAKSGLCVLSSEFCYFRQPERYVQSASVVLMISPIMSEYWTSTCNQILHCSPMLPSPPPSCTSMESPVPQKLAWLARGARRSCNGCCSIVLVFMVR